MLRRYETEKNYKNRLPQIIIENNNTKKNDHFVSEEDRRVKKITLSHYNSYLKEYTKTLKFPTSSYYSTDKLKHSVPFKDLKNINLNKKINFIQTFSLFNLNKKTSIFRTNINNNNAILSRNNLINYTNSVTQDYMYFDNKFYKQKTDDEILKYFIEGTFLSKPEQLRYFGIKEKNIYPHTLNKSDFEFYSKYLENLHKNENLTEHKSKKYELNGLNNHDKSYFNLDLKSICFQFEEIIINDVEKNIEELEANLDSNRDNNNNENEKGKEKNRLYLPFKYLPLLFLLKFSDFKTLISGILSYDYKNKNFNFVRKDDFEEIIKKYSEKCNRKLYNYLKDKNSEILKNCIYYENEFHYNNEFLWLVFDDDNNETKIFKLKIVFPLINFEMGDFNITFQRYCNKWLLLEMVKENFKSWDRYILFSLFLNKFLRHSISDILNRKKGFTSFFNKSQFIGPSINNYYSKKNNFSFFLTEINLNINHYFFIIPYQVSISKKGHDRFEKEDSVSLQLSDARKIYKLSQYYGLMGIFNKCMFYNKLKRSFYFSFKFLDNINDEYFLFLKEQKNQFIITNNDTKNVFKFNGNEYYLVIRDCLLCEKREDLMNKEEYKYYKIPENLYKFILDKENNEENEIILNLKNNINEIINAREVEGKSLSLYKTKSIKSLKSLKSMKRKESNSFKSAFSQFVNKNKFLKNKEGNIFENKTSEKDNGPTSLYKVKVGSFQNIRIFAKNLKKNI